MKNLCPEGGFSSPRLPIFRSWRMVAFRRPMHILRFPKPSIRPLNKQLASSDFNFSLLVFRTMAVSIDLLRIIMLQKTKTKPDSSGHITAIFDKVGVEVGFFEEFENICPHKDECQSEPVHLSLWKQNRKMGLSLHTRLFKPTNSWTMRIDHFNYAYKNRCVWWNWKRESGRYVDSMGWDVCRMDGGW